MLGSKKKHFLIFLAISISVFFLILVRFISREICPSVVFPPQKMENSDQAIPSKDAPLPSFSSDQGEDNGEGTGHAGTRRRIKKLLSLPRQGPNLRVRVLAEKGRLPVCDAEVVVRTYIGMDRARREAHITEHGDPRYGHLFLQGFDRLYRTNRFGMVSIPLQVFSSGHSRLRPKGYFVSASFPGRNLSCLPVPVVVRKNQLIYKAHSNDTLESGLDLVLVDSPVLQVKVINPEGVPVPGIPVALFYAPFGPDNYRRLIKRGYSLAPDGIFEFSNFGLLLRHFSKRPNPDPKGFFVGFNFPISKKRPSTYIPLTRSSLMMLPIKLTLPPSGSLVVHLFDAEKRPVEGDAWVVMVNAGSDNRYPWDNVPWYEVRKAVLKENAKRATNGKVEFPFVGLNLPLKLFGIHSSRKKIVHSNIHGPSAPGAKVETSLYFCDKDPIISGIAVDHLNRVFSFARLEVAFQRSPSADIENDPICAIPLEVVNTDKKGFFQIALPENVGSWKRRQIMLSACLEAKGKTRPSAVVRLPAYILGDAIDIGRVSLTVPPVVINGLVVDINSKPVPDARVLILKPRYSARTGRTSWRGMRSQKTMPDGSFEFRMRWDASTVRVDIDKKDMGFLNNQVFPTGTKGIRLALSGAGKIEGNVLLDPGVFLALSFLEVHLRSIDKGRKPIADNWSRVTRTIDKDGTFSWQNVIPGTYQFTVDLPSDSAVPFLVVESIKVVHGKTTRDPRLTGIDLRGMFKKITVTVVDASKRPLKWAKILGRKGLRANPGMTCLLVRPDQGYDLVISCSGYRTKRLKDVRSNVKVVLDDGISARVTVDNYLEIAKALGKRTLIAVGVSEKGFTMPDAILSPLKYGEMGLINPKGYTCFRSGDIGKLEIQFFLLKKVGRRTKSVYLCKKTIMIREDEKKNDFQFFLPSKIVKNSLIALEQKN